MSVAFAMPSAAHVSGGWNPEFTYYYDGVPAGTTPSGGTGQTGAGQTGGGGPGQVVAGGSAPTCSIVGTWNWRNSAGTTYIHSDGTMEYRGSDGRIITGTWAVKDSVNGVYTFSWTQNGAFDTLTISSDCNTLDGYNSGNDHITATRISGSDTPPTAPTVSQVTGQILSNSCPGLSGNPWDTAVGQNCFEQWISDVTSRLNAYDGDKNFNADKPYSINRYGVTEGNSMHSAYAPDTFLSITIINTGLCGPMRTRNGPTRTI